jgi:hypothetical protein
MTFDLLLRSAKFWRVSCSYVSPLLKVNNLKLIIIYILSTSYNDVFSASWMRIRNGAYYRLWLKSKMASFQCAVLCFLQIRGTSVIQQKFTDNLSFIRLCMLLIVPRNKCRKLLLNMKQESTNWRKSIRSLFRKKKTSHYVLLPT